MSDTIRGPGGGQGKVVSEVNESFFHLSWGIEIEREPAVIQGAGVGDVPPSRRDQGGLPGGSGILKGRGCVFLLFRFLALSRVAHI